MQTTLRPSASLLASVLLLASCASPPQLPNVDDAHKRPVNSLAAVELQACSHELHNSRMLTLEAQRSAETAATALAYMKARQQLVLAMQQRPVQTPQANSLYTVLFDFGSTRLTMPPDLPAALVDEAKNAPLVLLRGRTDGTSDSSAESHIASGRAAAVRDYLVAAGVDPARIRTTYQPSGDHAGDNASPSGRRLNRRVEIELYRARPVAVNVTTTPQP